MENFSAVISRAPSDTIVTSSWGENFNKWLRRFEYVGRSGDDAVLLKEAAVVGSAAVIAPVSTRIILKGKDRKTAIFPRSVVSSKRLKVVSPQFPQMHVNI